MSGTSVAAAVVAAAVAAGLAALLPTVLPRVRDGDVFARALPARWVLALVAAVPAALMALKLASLVSGADVYAVIPAYVWLAGAGTVMAFIDAVEHRLPDVLTLSSYPIVFLLLVVAALTLGHPRLLLHALVGMAGLFGLYFVIWFIYPPGMGFGDVKLSGALGLALGFLGSGAVFWGAVLGYLVSAVVALVVLARQRSQGRKAEVAHGPSMLVGFVLGVLVA